LKEKELPMMARLLPRADSFTVGPMLLMASKVADTAEAPLQLETKIPLGNVSGRIDHLASHPATDRTRTLVSASTCMSGARPPQSSRIVDWRCYVSLLSP
jgi:hypothetical protein